MKKPVSKSRKTTQSSAVRSNTNTSNKVRSKQSGQNSSQNNSYQPADSLQSRLVALCTTNPQLSQKKTKLSNTRSPNPATLGGVTSSKPYGLSTNRSSQQIRLSNQSINVRSTTLPSTVQEEDKTIYSALFEDPKNTRLDIVQF